MNIVLCGMPSVGKTSVAQVLSGMLIMPTFDTDEQIKMSFGDIEDIFLKGGEAYFRECESHIAKSLGKLNGFIISTGGGFVLNDANLGYLNSGDIIIYLYASVESLLKRVDSSINRPLLSSDVEGNMQRLFDNRHERYKTVSDIIIDTTNLTPEGVAQAIIEKLEV